MSGFEQGNLFSFFGFDAGDVTSKAEAKEAKVEEKKAEKAVAEKTTVTDKPKKKVVGLTGNSKVEFPVTVYGRGFKKVISEPTAPATINGVIKDVAKSNPEVKAGGSVYYDKETSSIFVNSNLHATDDDVLVEVGTSNVTVAYAGLQADLSALTFDGVDADELSVEKVTDKWVEINPAYTGCSLVYNAETLTATPVANGNMIKEFSLPVTISVSGEETTVTPENLGGKDKATEKEVTEFIFGSDFKASVSYYTLGGTTVAEYNMYDSKKLVKEIDWSFAECNKGAKEKKAATKYSLPLKVYFATLGKDIDLDSTAFDGNEKVTEDEVIDHLKKSYSFLSSKDRQIDVIYCKESNTLSVALISGKKG